MPLARIRTCFPEEVADLAETLIQAGYVVETVRPDDVRIAPADLEIQVDKLPVVEAWRQIPDAQEVFVAPGTPESLDIRLKSSDLERAAWFYRLRHEAGDRAVAARDWTRLQWREVRGWYHDVKHRYTPPREYDATVHPSRATTPETPPRIDVAIEETLRRRELDRRLQESQRHAEAEQARQMEESRRLAKDAAEAKALLEEQKKIETMVRATEALRARMVEPSTPVAEPVRRRPRKLLRTRRDRVFFRAGVAAFALSSGLAFVAAEALHPRPASAIIPNASGATIPFVRVQEAAQNAVKTPATTVPATIAPADTALASMTKNVKLVHPDGFGEEVIVHKPLARPAIAPKPKDNVIHYSDLN